ncbi:uncharacterized protein LOC122377241 [Amphibalanus amphitrite]|uniref:uncharacterized protein LOC122377241 n=1 Tax=Amphibalanus amphitrite TaxID=1232801 RepID=UPI001C915D75|nr:uncharacterized protein LOC122377241 [Amphibalanus amphitrite]XP_043213132.1 uncharacterized protein LOC122377241 [Amphibalanus amphitrite]
MTMSSGHKENDAQDTSYSPARIQEMICELNCHVALLREHLLAMGSSRDSPELRERIRRTRLDCMTSCRQTAARLLPHIRKEMESGILVDSQCLVLLFSCTQLLLRELQKTTRLIDTMPMDMSAYYESRPGPSSSGLGNVISQIILHVPITPNFQREELISIEKDCREIELLLDEMQEFMPKAESARVNMWAMEGHGLLPGKPRWRRDTKVASSCCCTGVSSLL